MEKERQSGEQERSTTAAVEQTLPTVNPAAEKSEPPKAGLHPAFYIATWITLSSSLIIFNKWILSGAGFPYPITLTSWHLGFATMMTQLMARFTTQLDSRKKVPMTGRVYLRAIVPIGLMFSLSLICGNVTYIYLSVSFIQMLKATTPVAVLLASWSFGVSPPNFKTLGNVSFIVLGVMIASYGELQFVLIGFLFQCGGIIFEAIRLVMVQRLLSGSEFKMDPLVSLYYFAPVCTIMNGIVALFIEAPNITLAQIQGVGYFTLFINGMIAFLLNVAVVFLIGKTSSLVMTLSGVLKDILLVMASMLIFRDPVSGLQGFGYTIALAGLVYYKLGSDKLKEHVSDAGRSWQEFSATKPTTKKLIFAGAAFVVFIILLVGIAQAGYVPEQYKQYASYTWNSWSRAISGFGG